MTNRARGQVQRSDRQLAEPDRASFRDETACSLAASRKLKRTAPKNYELDAREGRVERESISPWLTPKACKSEITGLRVCGRVEQSIDLPP
jgi:hypothetical protein